MDKINTCETKTNLIEVKELKVEKLKMAQKILDLSFGFHFNGQNSKISRPFNFSDNVINFVMGVMNDAKKTHGSKIEKEEEMKEKLVNYMMRLMQQVKDLEKYKEATRYMREFNKIDCYKVTFPEFEYTPGRRGNERVWG
jgi:hypothetical protein